MKSIENIENIENKRVILRLDLNVPIKNGKISNQDMKYIKKLIRHGTGLKYWPNI